MDQPSPAIKLCECGCGGPAPIATHTNTRSGAVKGQPQRYIKGHVLRGGNHYAWRGDDVGYQAIHAYLRNHFPKAGACDECGERGPTDYALIKGRSYTKSRDDYRELCRTCHVRYDDLGYGRYWASKGQSGDPEGDAPACACGCGKVTEWNRKHKRWNRYFTGHYRPEAPFKDEAWLREQYVTRRRTLSDIATECGVTRTTIKRFVVQFSLGERAPHTETCAKCGAGFETRPQAGSAVRFCSDACKSAYRRATGTDDVERDCHQCGSAFTVNRYESTAHCSQSCAATCQHAGGCPR